MKARLVILFYDQYGNIEEGIDDGGLFKEFLTELSKQVFDPQRGLFKLTAEQTIYPNPNA